MGSLQKITRIFHSLDLVLICCVFLTIETQADQILPPQNLAIQWSSDFQPHFSWEPPPHSMMNCNYELRIMNNDSSDTEYYQSYAKTTWTCHKVMQGGFLQLFVKANCNNVESEEVSISHTSPDLVTNISCVIHTSELTTCTWVNVIEVPDLRFSYKLQETFNESSIEGCRQKNVQECLKYKNSGGFRTGCDLKASFTQTLDVSFSGIVNGKMVRNSFEQSFNVSPPPLKWNVTKTEKEFVFAWDPPEVGPLYLWTFRIFYTECGIQKNISIGQVTSTKLSRVPTCPYSMTIQGESDNGKTKPSDPKIYDADTKPIVYAAIILPLMFSCLAALAFVCCRKNKENIFPKIPVPRDLLSDISDNNNKSAVPNLHVPAEEEDYCKITLVMDPQTDNLKG